MTTDLRFTPACPEPVNTAAITRQYRKTHHRRLQSAIQGPQDKAMDARRRQLELEKVQQSWASRGLRGSAGAEGADCFCCAEFQPMQPVDEEDFDGGLWGAAVQGDAERVSFLLVNRQCNPNQLDLSGFTPLHYAAAPVGKVDVCALLLQCNAEVDCHARKGRATPLHRACTVGARDVAALLLDWNASPTAEDADGQTPLDKALQCGHSGVVELLRAIPEVQERSSGR
mmetsp:Transcript_2453/g.4430  ORF Transcript_2453/g.4430 Transcript_2453/m.4430 type:complete len:228 (+) Transcript_2453:66-749(+)